VALSSTKWFRKLVVDEPRVFLQLHVVQPHRPPCNSRRVVAHVRTEGRDDARRHRWRRACTGTVLQARNCQWSRIVPRTKNGSVAVNLVQLRKIHTVGRPSVVTSQLPGGAQAKACRVRVDEKGIDSVGAESRDQSSSRHCRRHRYVDWQRVRGRHEAVDLCRPARIPTASRYTIADWFDRGRQDPGKTFKNKKKNAGPYGVDRVKTKLNSRS